MRRRANGEGSIWHVRGRNLYAAAVTIEGRRFVRYARTRADAGTALVGLLTRAQQHTPPPSSQLTTGDFLARWTEETLRPRVRMTTYRRYEQEIRVYLIPQLGTVRLTQLTPQRVQTFLNALAAHGLSPASIVHARGVLRTALADAMKWGLVERNVAALVDPPRREHLERSIPSPEQAHAMLAAMAGWRLEGIVSVALALGLRLGEALGLRWDDIDLDSATLTVARTLQYYRGDFELSAPKTARSQRTLALPAGAVAALRAHRVRQLAERVQAGPEWTGERWGDLVFTTPTGGPLIGAHVTRDYQLRLKRAGLPTYRFHDLRHAAASLLLAQGVPPRTVMEILGHSTVALTMELYGHSFLGEQRAAAGKMDTALGWD